MRHGRQALESAAGICRETRQRNAAGRSLFEFPEKSQTHPMPRAPARAPAAPPALPCPRAHDTSTLKNTPDAPPPRAKRREAPKGTARMC